MDGVHLHIIVMNRFFAEDIKENTAVLDADESRHLAMVLRLKTGEKIEVVNNGRLFLAEITDNNKKAARAKILSEKHINSEPNLKVTLFQALPKG
ncbi:MAG: RsmE family RNA methyltransferase, partial [Clostridia bacterium]|nr:RsmE family RNA methyltransferase [Clostridia bacterium]